MTENAKDPAIKLFGRTIPFPEIPPPAAVPDSAGDSPPPHPAAPLPPYVDESINQDRPYSPESSAEDEDSNRVGEDQEPADKAPSGRNLTDGKHETLEEIADPNASAVVNDNLETPSVDNEAAKLKSTSKTEEDQSDTSDPQEKTLKKPDKILPCPRCNSLDTKFCYFNNYNVNQPRHFCKNCQRYWTAGGTMRNVPVGAGRRKNKNSASHYRHISVSEALQNARADLPNGIHHPTLKPNGTVLAFGSDTPFCESMTSVLSIAEKTMQNHGRNGFHKPELRVSVSNGVGDHGDDHSSRSSVTAANSEDDVGKNAPPDPRMLNCHSFPPQIPCFPGGPWPYPWNPAQWSSLVPPPAFCPPGFPMPFYPAPPYWGCTLPGTWNAPWVAPLTSPASLTAPSSGPDSPSLGKRSRDENMLPQTCSSEEEEPQKENNPERCLWVPKTLRFNDPGEAAKSSIWATLGIGNDKADSVSGGGLFKAFQSKGEGKNHISETSSVLQANPAALSRSLNFHESS